MPSIVEITEICLPNIQTSLAEVNRLKLIDSGAIHLIGIRLTEASNGEKNI